MTDQQASLDNLTTVYVEQRGRVINAVLGRVSRIARDEAEDCLHDAFADSWASVLNKGTVLPTTEDARKWLTTASIRAAYDLAKASERVRAYHSSNEEYDPLLEAPSADYTPEDAAVLAEQMTERQALRSRLWAAFAEELKTLSLEMRRAATLVYIHGWTLRQAAAKLGLARAAVKSMTFRLRDRIRRRLGLSQALSRPRLSPEKQRIVLELTSEGLSQRDIAAAIGCKTRGAVRAVQKRGYVK
jgi:RNA polymerase sigma factor (sigma-70 family)